MLPYWDTLKKKLFQDGISSLTIIHAPTLAGHPIVIAVLLAAGLFVPPPDPYFYVFWFAMVVMAAAALTLNIWGLVESKFFAAQILGKLGFVTSSLGAIFVIGERLLPMQMAALGLAIVGVGFFVWPQKLSRVDLVWDRGVLFMIASIIFSGLATVFYKLATFHTPNYFTFLSGRLIGDLIGWSLIWIIISIWPLHRNPVVELFRCFRTYTGLAMVIGMATSALLLSWLIYQLPVTTFAMLGTLTIPAAYFLSRIKYKEQITVRMWSGTIFILGSLVLFLI